MNEYLRAFIIGSSFPVFALYFIAVSNYDESITNYTYKNYTIIAPLFLGTINMVGLYLSNVYSLTKFQRFILTALLGASIVATTITVLKLYNFESQQRWYKQYFYLFMTYIFVFTIIVKIIDSNL